MPRAYIVDVTTEPTGRRKVQAVIQFGGNEETLNPRDVGLQTIDSIVLSPQSILRTQQSFPIGSVGVKFLTAEGTPGPGGKVRGGGPGSTIILRWASGSTGTRLAVTKAIGSYIVTGTRTAHAWISGN